VALGSMILPPLDWLETFGANSSGFADFAACERSSRRGADAMTVTDGKPAKAADARCAH